MNTYRVILHLAAPRNDTLHLQIGNAEQNQNSNDELGADWKSAGQSSNIEDRRGAPPPRGMRRVTVQGGLVMRSYLHLAAWMPYYIANSLLRRGFQVKNVETNQLGWGASKYYFWITLWVYNQYSLQSVQVNVENALTDLANPSSIRITSVY